MNDPIGQIDLENKKLVCSASNIRKLSSKEGCQLNLITDKVFDMRDDDDIEDDDGDDDDGDLGHETDSLVDEIFDREDDAYEDTSAREDRVQKEFISLVLNANRDPVKPGTRFRFKEFQEGVSGGEFECDTRNLEHGFVGIHRQYENVGNYETYMAANKFEEVSPGRVYKLKRVTGVQLPTSEQALVIYNCAFWSEGSKEPFDSTWLRRTTITSNLATDSILPGLRELLLSCKQNEFCEAFIRPEAAFGRLGVPPRIPANATIFCLLEIVKVVSRDKYATITLRPGQDNPGLAFEDLYEAGDEARRRGNYYFEQQHYPTAMQRYKSAIRMLECLSFKNQEEEARASELLVRLFNNCARTANAMGNPRLALAACKQARLINDKDPKTYWHRMTAWAKKGHTDRALGVARRAIQLFLTDHTTVRAFQKAAEEFKIKMQKEQSEVDNLHKLMGRAFSASA